MGQVKLKPYYLDDQTVIYVQANDVIDTQDLSESLAPQATLAPAPTFEEDLPDLPSPMPSPGADTDGPNDGPDHEVEAEDALVSKEWTFQGRHRIPSDDEDTTPTAPTTPPERPTPAQRVGTLVKNYTTHLVQDIRDTALSDIEIEKVVLEFGIGLDTTAQIPYIASSSVECSVKVAIECKISPPQGSSPL